MLPWKKFTIRNRFTKQVMYSGKAKSLKQFVERLVKDRKPLCGAELSVQDLSGANLLNADLRGAGLAATDLSGANLAGVRLSGARLFAADLHGAKNYYYSKEFFAEVVSCQGEEYFNSVEWCLIGKVMTYMNSSSCYHWLRQEKNLPYAKSIAAKLKKVGFSEYKKKLNNEI